MAVRCDNHALDASEGVPTEACECLAVDGDEVKKNDSLGTLHDPLGLHRCKGRHYLPIAGQEMLGDQPTRLPKSSEDHSEGRQADALRLGCRRSDCASCSLDELTPYDPSLYRQARSPSIPEVDNDAPDHKAPSAALEDAQKTKSQEEAKVETGEGHVLKVEGQDASPLKPGVNNESQGNAKTGKELRSKIPVKVKASGKSVSKASDNVFLVRAGMEKGAAKAHFGTLSASEAENKSMVKIDKEKDAVKENTGTLLESEAENVSFVKANRVKDVVKENAGTLLASKAENVSVVKANKVKDAVKAFETQKVSFVKTETGKVADGASVAEEKTCLNDEEATKGREIQAETGENADEVADAAEVQLPTNPCPDDAVAEGEEAKAGAPGEASAIPLSAGVAKMTL